MPTGAIRDIYIQWAIRDRITDRVARINRTIDLAVRKASLASTQYMYMSAAFEKSLANTAYFFAQVDKAEREAIIRSKHHSRVVQELALKYDMVKSKVVAYASQVRASLSTATSYIREHSLVLMGMGLAAGYSFMRAIQAGANWELTLQSIKRLAQTTGRDYQKIVKIIEEETDNLVDRAALAEGVLKLMTTSLSDEQIQQFIRAVKEGSTAMGQDFNEQIALVAKGFKQLISEILDNIGVNTRLEVIYEKASKQFGVSRDQLTEAQIQQVLFNEILQQTAKYQGMWNEKLKSSAGAISGFSVAMRDLTTAVGETFLPLITPAIQGVTAFINTINKIPIARTVIGATLLTGAFLGLAGAFYAHVVPAIETGASLLLTRWVPASVQAAYASGGLTAALRASAIAFRGLAVAVLTNPITWAILGIVSAILLLQDVLVKGWEKSYLGQAVAWFLEKLSFLKPVAEGVATAINYLRQGFEWITLAIQRFITWIQQGLDAIGPLKYALFGPAGAIIFLAQNFDKVTSAIQRFIDWITAIPSKVQEVWRAITENPIFKVIQALTPFGAAIVTRKTIETKTINLIETSKKEELLRRNITEEEIKKRAIEQYEYVKSIKLQGVTNEEEIKRQLEAKFGGIIINPQIIPYVGKPEYDKRFYEEGSIVLKVKTPEIKPIVQEPEMPKSLLDIMYLRVKPLIEAIKLPRLTDLATKFILDRLPKLPEFVSYITYLPKLIQPEVRDLTAGVMIKPKMPELKIPEIPSISPIAITPPALPAHQTVHMGGVKADIVINLNDVKLDHTGRVKQLGNEVSKQIEEAVMKALRRQKLALG